jgi:WD40 repeat protein
MRMPIKRDPAPSMRLPAGVNLLRAFEGHRKPVRSLAFDPAGAILASGGDDGDRKALGCAHWQLAPEVIRCRTSEMVH